MGLKKNKKTTAGSSSGYTIIEAIIVLAVSATLFLSVIGVYSGQNRRTRFSQNVQTFAQELRDAMNDIETGYFPNNNNFSCLVDGTGNLVFGTPGQDTQGTSEDCVFAGKAVQFSGNSYDVYTLAANRKATGLDDTHAKALPSLVDKNALDFGFDITARPLSAFSNSAKGVVFFTSFGQSLTAQSTGGSVGNRMLLATLDSTIDGNGVFTFGAGSIDRAKQGITVCLEQGGRTASVVIGQDGSQYSVNVNIDAACTP